MNHKLFGPFLRNWGEKRVFPTKFKYAMVLTMMSSLVIMWFTTGNIKAIMWTGGFMVLVAIWGWRYPGSLEEHQRRKDAGDQYMKYISLNQKKIAEEQKKISCTKLSFKLQMERY